MEHICKRVGCGKPRPGGRGYCSVECYEEAVELGAEQAPKPKPTTDPRRYMDEPDLAVEAFGCDACEVPAGTPCEGETHMGRVDKLRSLRAYCQGRT